MPGPSIAERMAAFMKPEAPSAPASEKSPPEAQGKRLHAGMVERETVVVGMVRYAKRFAVLYSDPVLGLYTDGSGSGLKSSRSLAGCTVTQDGQVVEITLPSERPIKLRAATVEEAQAWHAQIEEVAASGHQEVPAAPSAAGDGVGGAQEAAAAPTDAAPEPPAAAATAAAVPRLGLPAAAPRKDSAELWAKDHTMTTPR